LGAQVNLVSGPVSLKADKSINLIKVNSANEMLESVMNCMSDSDIFIGCAAVSDFKPADYSDSKIKKDSTDNLDIKLEKNRDILSIVSDKFPSSYVVGFAAETVQCKRKC
jgi:phosphopantothenoylcysteine decarboxylase/phosphopantothenate--cysteine ligase